MPQILVDAQIEPAHIDELHRSTGLTVALAPGEHETRRPLPIEMIRDVRALLCTFLPDNHAEMKSLQFVQLCSAGFAQVENLGLRARGVRVCNASGVNDIPIAEWAITMMVALARDMPLLFHNQQQGIWDRDMRFQTEIRGRTLGIWGYGGIGRETARLARAMGLRVHVLTRTGRLDSRPRFRVEGTGDDTGAMPHRVFSMNEVDAFCESLDFLLLAMPQTPQNIGIVNRRIFDCLPKGAFLLNPARGPLVNEADLLEALRSGAIAGAALDTHFKYPLPSDHPLWRMPNVIMTPHISGSSKSPHFTARIWQLFGENLHRWKAGDALLNELSAAQLDPAYNSK
jgi:phosphoglycerate dehydrogenase-like enzyme